MNDFAVAHFVLHRTKEGEEEERTAKILKS
jgi:predicted DNA-binding protein